MALRLLLIPICYLLGSLSPSHAVVWLTRRVDLRRVGSRNLGATSALKAGGPWCGLAALTGDIGKGVLAALLARWVFGPGPLALVGLIAVVAGHNFPVFYGFRGGKGASASCGALLVLAPALILPAIAAGVVAALLTDSLTPPEEGRLIGLMMVAATLPATSLCYPTLMLPILIWTVVVFAAYWWDLPVVWLGATMVPPQRHAARVTACAVVCGGATALLSGVVGPQETVLVVAAAGLWVASELMLLAVLAGTGRQWGLVQASAGAAMMAGGIGAIAALASGQSPVAMLSTMWSGHWPGVMGAMVWPQAILVHHLILGLALACGGMMRRLAAR